MDKLAYKPEEAQKVAGIGNTKFYEEVREGRLITRKIGRRTVVLKEDLEAWLAALPIAERRPFPRGGR